MSNRPSTLLAVVLSMVLLVPLARAGDPFVYTITTNSGSPQTIKVRGDSLIRVTDSVILGYGRASAVAGRDVTATLNYAGVPNALRLSLNADRTAGSLRYNLPGGPTDTFSSSGAPSFIRPAQVIDDQVYGDLTDPHNHLFERLQQQLNRQSYIMPLDGNPSSATAFLADQTFGKYAMVRDGEPQGFAAPADAAVRYDPVGRPYVPANQFFQPVFWFDMLGQSISTNGYGGYDLRFGFNAAGRFAPVIGWSLSIPVQYRNIDGAESDTVGVEFGLPVNILRPSRRVPLAWTVTPFVEFAFNDSRDLGSTQALFDGGVASRLALTFGRRGQWTLAMGNQFTGFVGLGPVRDHDTYYDDGYYYYGDRYAFRGHVAQQLFKNGVQLTRRFAYGLSVTASCTYSTYVANAATDQWWTPRVGVAWNFTPNFAVRLAYQADLANRYQSQGGDAQFDFRY